jgi:hypothetical protein
MHKDRAFKMGDLTNFGLARTGFGLYQAGRKTPDEIWATINKAGPVWVVGILGSAIFFTLF